MVADSGSVMAFGPFRLYLRERRLEKDGAPVPLGGRAFDLLVYLVERAGEVVPSRELLRGVWRDVNVVESSLRVHIRTLREALGESRDGARYIANAPGQGYCFAAPVERLALSAAAPPAPLQTTRSPLPERAGAIVGRSAVLQKLGREILQHRLLTIAGPAGIGKTTVAIAAAAAARESFGEAVFFVDLAPIEQPSLIVSALLSALRGGAEGADFVASIVRRVGDRRFLLLLDNCEQVVEEVARIAETIVRDIPGAHVLATSRETLGVAGERVHRLAPLEYPPKTLVVSASEAAAYSAVQLFVERAAASPGGFVLDEKSAPAVAEICRRLDGIPFAIELAAGRIEAFGVFDLARQLNDMFAILTKGRRSALPRRRTLLAMLEWGHSQLTPVLQTTLRRLAVFPGKFTLPAALEVASGRGLSQGDVLEALAGLVNKSLLTADEAAEAVHYRLLEATRIYASEKLAASGEARETRKLHAQYNLALFGAGENWALADGETSALAKESRIEDVRAALDWAFSPEGEPAIGLQLIAASSRLWFQAFLNVEYSERLERALALLAAQDAPDPTLEMRLQTARGHVYWYLLSKPEGAERAFTRALELAERVGDAKVRIQSL